MIRVSASWAISRPSVDTYYDETERAIREAFRWRRAFLVLFPKGFAAVERFCDEHQVWEDYAECSECHTLICEKEAAKNDERCDAEACRADICSDCGGSGCCRCLGVSADGAYGVG